MKEYKKDLGAKQRLLMTAGATTLAATGAVFAGAVMNPGANVAHADQTTTTSQVQTGWVANTADQVKAAAESQGQADNLSAYSVQWGDTLDVISQVYGLTTAQAARNLGLTNSNLLVAGYSLQNQAAVVQSLKDQGLLTSAAGATQAVASDQGNLVVLQPSASSETQSQSTQNTQTESQSAVNGQSESATASSQATQDSNAQSMADSQSLSTASSQSVAQSTADAAASQAPAQDTSAATPTATTVTASASQVASARPTTATLQVKTVKKAATVTATANSTTATTAQSLQVANSTSAASQPVPVQSTSQAAQPAPAQSTSQAPAQSSQKVNTDELIAWFDNHKGQLTYSMTGNRDGSDGTADCSGAMTEALYEAGASKPAYLYNTDSLPGYLTANGYQLISTNTPWDAQRGDIVIWGQQGASGGAVGHVQVIISNDPNARAISVNYATQGAAGTAVTEWNYDTAYAQTSNGKFLPYYVYRQA